MENLKVYRDKFRYDSGTQGEVVEIEVYYDKGGANYFAGRSEPRGVYVSISPVTLRDQGRSFMLMSGTKIFVHPCKAKSPKILEQIATRVDAVVIEAVKEFESGDKKAALLILKNAASPAQVEAVSK